MSNLKVKVIATDSDKQLYGDESDKLKRLKKGEAVAGFKYDGAKQESEEQIIDTNNVELPSAGKIRKRSKIDTKATR